MKHIDDSFIHRRGGPRGPHRGGPGRYGGRGRARRGDVRTSILLILSENGPANGYQLMQTIEERSEGAWRPSPGSVYPTIAQLTDEGLVAPAGEDGKSIALTPEGEAALADRPDDAPAPWDVANNAEGGDRGALRSEIGALFGAAKQVFEAGTPGQRKRAVELIASTRRSLYAILAEDEPADAGDAKE